mgnify:FL=1
MKRPLNINVKSINNDGRAKCNLNALIKLHVKQVLVLAVVQV